LRDLKIDLLENIVNKKKKEFYEFLQIIEETNEKRLEGTVICEIGDIHQGVASGASYYFVILTLCSNETPI
jgi:hypothetical protein